MIEPASDDQLLRSFKDGDAGAFEELVKRYRPRLVAYASAFTGASAADDVVQDTFVAAYRALAEHDVSELRAWLYTVVRNRSINHVTAKSRRVEPLSEALHLEDSRQANAHDDRSTLESIVSELKLMPVGQRSALVKHELEGLDYGHIARDLDLSVGAAKQLVYRARARLRRTVRSLVPPAVTGALREHAANVAGTAASPSTAVLIRGGMATSVVAGLLAVGPAARHPNSAPSRSDSAGTTSSVSIVGGRTGIVAGSLRALLPAVIGGATPLAPYAGGRQGPSGSQLLASFPTAAGSPSQRPARDQRTWDGASRPDWHGSPPDSHSSDGSRADFRSSGPSHSSGSFDGSGSRAQDQRVQSRDSHAPSAGPSNAPVEAASAPGYPGGNASSPTPAGGPGYDRGGPGGPGGGPGRP